MKNSEKPVTILLFALAKEKSGRDSVEILLSLPTSVRQLKEKMTVDYPNLAPLIAISRVAVNRSFATDEETISGVEEIALIPPVSGG